jgi:Lysophospholipase catalytic domain
MMQGVLKAWNKRSVPSMQSIGPHFKRYKRISPPRSNSDPVTLTIGIGPLGKFIVGTSSIILLSTGSILCDSECQQSTPKPAPSSREHTVEDARDSKQRQKKKEAEQSAAEQSALDRIRASFVDIQAKLLELEPPTLSPETFGLPPNLREWVDKVRAEVSFAPGSVSDEIWAEARDPLRNPEIERDARVWMGNEISPEEVAFYEKRREFTRKALARYLGVHESEVDARDVPNIAVAGSGGGYRAMIGTTGYFKAMKACGLFDCVTYMAGISPLHCFGICS